MPELHTERSIHVHLDAGREEQCRYRIATGRGGSTLATTMAGAAPAHRGGAALIGGEEGEALRWRSGVEGARAVVEISAGGRWARLCLYGVGR